MRSLCRMGSWTIFSICLDALRGLRCKKLEKSCLTTHVHIAAGCSFSFIEIQFPNRLLLFFCLHICATKSLYCKAHLYIHSLEGIAYRSNRKGRRVRMERISGGKRRSGWVTIYHHMCTEVCVSLRCNQFSPYPSYYLLVYVIASSLHFTLSLHLYSSHLYSLLAYSSESSFQHFLYHP